MRLSILSFLAILVLAAAIPLFGQGLSPGAPGDRERAARMAGAMSARALAAQVLLTGIDGKGALDSGMIALLRRIPAGGIMLFRYNLAIEKKEVAPFLKAVSDTVIAGGGMAPFMAADHEGGSVHRFGEGVARLPAPLSYWEKSRAGDPHDDDKARRTTLLAVEEDAFRSGQEIRGLGITVNLAPVAEVLSNENRAFLDDRSYGPDAAFVEAACSAFIRGMERAGIACVLKHFPGNTGEDPHTNKSVITADKAALNETAIPMIRLLKRTEAPLSENTTMVMVSHAVVSAWDSKRSASLSDAVIGGWLRGELGFNGVVLADDFTMGAVALEPGEAAVEALIAGVDMVMAWPPNINAIHKAILAALTEGRLSRQRLEEAASRIIYEKIRLGLLGNE
jgi:beta-N-acetylhexosaminidase